jgi:bacteriocin biosynthesis cyclodehydratase domain-containing protein
MAARRRPVPHHCDADAGSVQVPDRPMIKRGLRPLRRDDTSVQLGLDPDRAVVLTGLDDATLHWLDRLDGSRERASLITSATAAGIPDGVASGLLDLLAARGVLDDAGAERTVCARLPPAERDRLRPDLASLALRGPRPDAGTGLLETRRQAAVEVRGSARVGASAATLLAAAGIGHVAVRDSALARAADVAPAGLSPCDVGTRREAAARAAVRRAAPATRPALPAGRQVADLVLLAPDGPVDPGERDRLLRAGVPHLLASVRETTGVVGPLVLPGRSACLRCLDLARADRDPAWPRVAAQVATESSAQGPAISACDTVLATAVAVHAVLQALAFLDGALPAAVDGTLEITLPEGRLRRRSWTPHPGCGCGWADAG